MDSGSERRKGVGPLTALIASPVIAGVLAILYAAAFVADVPGSSASEIPRLFLIPFFFVLGFIMYFFISWSPILGLSLLIYLLLPRRRNGTGWSWFISWAIFILSLPVCYVCLHAVLTSPPMRKYFPFNYFSS